MSTIDGREAITNKHDQKQTNERQWNNRFEGGGDHSGYMKVSRHKHMIILALSNNYLEIAFSSLFIDKIAKRFALVCTKIPCVGIIRQTALIGTFAHKIMRS